MGFYDVAVVGLGIMGSAALEALARRGLRVVGIEQFTLGHQRGSSHGSTRVIRLGYFEHPSYVPLLRAVYPLWRDLATRAGQNLLTITGIVEIGRPDSEIVAGTLTASRLHDLAHECLDAAAVMRRFPALRLPDDFVGVFQPQGGFLRAQAAGEAFRALSQRAGADIRSEERVLTLEPNGRGMRVHTSRGDIEVARVIVTAGPWLKSLLPSLGVPLQVTRQVPAWFEPKADSAALFAPGRFPVFILQNRDGTFYGFPADGDAGVKVARHHHLNEAVDPDNVDRNVSTADIDTIRIMLAAHVPGANGRLLDAETCLYTMTPDGDFILDRLPANPNVIVASPCSGHGFKFAPVIGEILADLASTGTTSHDISRFSFARF